MIMALILHSVIFVLFIVILGSYLLLALEFWIMKDYWLLIAILVFTLFLALAMHCISTQSRNL